MQRFTMLYRRLAPFLILNLLLAWVDASKDADCQAPVSTPQAKRPNFVFIMTDDQDRQLNSLDYMPKLQRLVGDEGTVFEKHFCTVALCCPSGVSLMTGRLAHNTNVTDVSPPYGMHASPSILSLTDTIRWISQIRRGKAQR